jgi:NAD(P)-dependent dehydrogenase (short-subunit alcohol dehydrogenase family)
VANRNPQWDVRNLPKNPDRVFFVTGGNAGIGYFIAEQLASTGATVFIGARNEMRASAAIKAIRAEVPNARVLSAHLDLSDINSVRSITGLLGDAPRLDGLILNAGVLAQSDRSETVNGHELMMGTNHLGHFALVSQLLPVLDSTPGSRVVTLSSVASRFAHLDMDDLQSTAGTFKGFRTYVRSKLAQSIFALELERRLRSTGSDTQSLLAHPGGAIDGLTPSRPPLRTRTRAEHAKALPQIPVAQSKEHAAWPAVRAALDPNAHGGQLWGPRLLRTQGKPSTESVPKRWTDHAAATALWDESVRLTGATWPILDGDSPETRPESSQTSP